MKSIICKNTFCLFLLILISAKVSFSQVEKKGNVEIIQDERIGRLVEKHKALNERQSDVDGYRIQIFFDSGNNSKKKASDAMQRFMEKFPETKAYISFKEPYYRVRVGNFRTLIESEGFLKKIQPDYPNGFPVKEKIYFQEIN
ncbi:MAG TPA: SPOR domain-containing protein [Bacteroidales bacterium]|jgi:SPOR domain